jgi:DNA-binding transcriptional LysR family regulator
MVPTSHAQQIYREFTAALARVDGAVEDSQHFAPLQSHRRFRIAMSDIGEMVFLPPLLARLQALAPHVELEVVDVAMPDLARRLATGEVSAAIGNLPGLSNDTKSEELFEERYVCLLRKNHSSIGDQLTLENFTAASHVHVSSAFSGHNLIEETLRTRHGIRRRIALQIPHFAILARLIATSELLVLLPSRVAKQFESYENVRSLELPVPMPRFNVRLHWHEHDNQNVANKWLRGIITDALTGI